MSNNKHAAFQAVIYLNSLLKNSEFSAQSVIAQESDKGEYVVSCTLSITQEELIQATPLLQDASRKHNVAVFAHTESGDAHTGIPVANPLDEMVAEVDKELVAAENGHQASESDVLDLDELDDVITLRTTAKPATIADAQKTPKIVRRKAKVDDRLDGAAEALAKHKPKPVTAAQNMTPRTLSKADLSSLATEFGDDWEKDLEIDAGVAKDEAAE